MSSTLPNPSLLRRALAARGRNRLIVGALSAVGIVSILAAGVALWQRAQAYKAYDVAAREVDELRQQLQQRQHDSLQAAATQAWLQRVRDGGLGASDWISVPQVLRSSNVAASALGANLRQLEAAPGRLADLRAISLESADRGQAIFDAGTAHYAVNLDGKLWMRRSGSTSGKQR